MKFFVEGVDGSGKTTLIKRLNEVYNIPILQGIKRYRNKKIELEKWTDFLIYDNKSGLVDRSILTEIVYRSVDKEVSFLSLDNLDKLLKYLSHNLIIYCKNKNSYDKAIIRGEDNITDKKIHSLIETSYECILRFCNKFYDLEYIIYDYEKDKLEDLIKQINGVIYGKKNE